MRAPLAEFRPSLRTALALVPAALGVLLAVVAQLTVPRTRLFLEVSPALLAGLLGVGVTAVLAGRTVLARRAAVRRALEVAAVRADAERARRRFVQRLDHELKNPLTALLTALSEPGVSASTAPDAGVPTARDLTVAHHQADRIRRLLRDLRRVADVETAELDSTPVDVGALLHEAVESAVADSGTGRTVRVEVPAAPWPLPTVTGDPDLLLVAVYNLVANALKFTGDGDVVEARGRETGEQPPWVVIEVADTGPGVADDEQELVFEELARGRSAVGVPGSGVGLALVRVIARRHGGTVDLRSRLGHGTSVALRLPAAPRRPAPADTRP